MSLNPGGAPGRPVVKLQARVLNKALTHKASNGSAHWSSRKVAAAFWRRVVLAVQRIWRKHGLQPCRLEPYLMRNEPDFETKAADVIDLCGESTCACGRVRVREDSDPAAPSQGPYVPTRAVTRREP